MGGGGGKEAEEKEGGKKVINNFSPKMSPARASKVTWSGAILSKKYSFDRVNHQPLSRGIGSFLHVALQLRSPNNG